MSSRYGVTYFLLDKESRTQVCPDTNIEIPTLPTPTPFQVRQLRALVGQMCNSKPDCRINSDKACRTLSLI